MEEKTKQNVVEQFEEWEKFCIYCKAESTDTDALGLPCCSKHTTGADEYVREQGYF